MASHFMQPEISSLNWMVQSVAFDDRHQSSHRASSLNSSINQQAISPEVDTKVDTNWERTRDSGYLVQYAVRPPTPILSTRPQSEQSPGAVWVRCPG